MISKTILDMPGYGFDFPSQGHPLPGIQAAQAAQAAQMAQANLGADINRGDRDGKTPLWWAAERGDADLCRRLLAQGKEAQRNGDLFALFA